VKKKEEPVLTKEEPFLTAMFKNSHAQTLIPETKDAQTQDGQITKDKGSQTETIP
jgi:hypothetical protein